MTRGRRLYLLIQTEKDQNAINEDQARKEFVSPPILMPSGSTQALVPGPRALEIRAKGSRIITPLRRLLGRRETFIHDLK